MIDDLPESAVPDPDFPSGEWIGFYVNDGSNHQQEMHLSFREGSMSGAGGDDVGEFSIRGGYDPESKEVWWTKTYLGSHSVHYRGYREIKGIWGLWEIPPASTDGFHIWPRRHGTAPAETAAAEVDEPVVVGASARSSGP